MENVLKANPVEVKEHLKNNASANSRLKLTKRL